MSLKFSSSRTHEILLDLPELIDRSEMLISTDSIDYSPPKMIDPGSLEHRIFLTLTMTVDNGCDSGPLWNAARRAYEEDQTRYLFLPKALYESDPDQILLDLKKTGLSRNKNQNAEIWKKCGIFLFQKWGGDPGNFIRSCGGDSKEILNLMIPARYHEVYDFHHFLGEKKGQKWLLLLKRTAQMDQIWNLNNISVTTDIHVVRASVAVGLLYGTYSGQISHLSQKVRELWEDAFRAIPGGDIGICGPELIDALRNLSRNGCTQKDGKRGICPAYGNCPFSRFCVTGIFSFDAKGAFIDTKKNPDTDPAGGVDAGSG
jgi:hypothetical protein